jgi:CBS domain-containing protein
MKVENLMNGKKVQYCNVNSNLSNVAKLMKENNCGALPVLNNEKQVVGIITDRDVALALVQNGTIIPDQIKVDHIMSHKVHTITPQDDVSTALKQMRTKQVGRLPVVDKDGKLQGIISLHNLLHAVTKDGKTDLENFPTKEESVAKTIKALTARYTDQHPAIKKTEAITKKEKIK